MAMPEEFRALLERYNQLGRLLPQSELDQDIALRDKRERSSLRVILAEMKAVQRQIDEYLDLHGSKRQ